MAKNKKKKNPSMKKVGIKGGQPLAKYARVDPLRNRVTRRRTGY
jgi:hypothetical protein